MASLTTLYRAVVMISVAAIAYQGWKHFGPSREQVSSMAVQAVELIGRAWNEARPTAAEPNAGMDPRRLTSEAAVPAPALTAEPVLRAGVSPADARPSMNAPINVLSAAQLAAPPLSPVPEDVAEQKRKDITPITGAGEEGDHLQSLYSQLERLGAHDPQLKPWGNNGQLYRFRCSASLVDSPALSRHFESVAAEPVVAVEEVVAAIEAWRTAQRHLNRPR